MKVSCKMDPNFISIYFSVHNSEMANMLLEDSKM